MPFVRRHRTYYKYGTEPNATIVGSPTIVDGVVSGFSGDNHLTFPSNFDVSKGQNWEIVFGFTTASSFGGTEALLSKTENVAYQCRFGLTNGKPIVTLSNTSETGGGSSFVALKSTEVLQNNTPYLLKLEYKNGVYSLYLSRTTDVENWELVQGKEVSTVFASTKFNRIGYGYDTGSSVAFTWLGSIDLSQSYIKINGKEWWHGTKAVVSTESDHDYYLDRNKMYQLTAIERTYYKYDYQDWTQPVLTANDSDSSFVVSASSELEASLAAWKSFDGVIDSNCWISASVDISEEAPQYYYIKTDTPLKISSISVTNRTGSYPHSVTKGILQASVDGDSWIDIVQINNDIVSAGATWMIEANETVGYKHHRIKITDYYLGGDSNKYVALGHLVITAQKAVGFELNVKGSDIYQDWKQPILTANGTLGGDGFAVYCDKASSSYPIYKAFDGSSSNFTDIAHPDSNVVIYNPKPLKVTTIKIANRSDVEVTAVTGYTIYGSNDNSSWEELVSGTNDITSKGSVWDIDLSSNTKGFKYYKIDITSAYISTGTYQIAEITLIAQELKAIGGTVEDADYYTDNIINHSPMTSKTKYYKYAYQDWEQPILTENGTLGGDKFAVSSNVAQYSGQGVYKLFDGDTSGCFHSTSGVTTGYIDLYNPKPLKITNILVNNQNSGGSENRASTSGNVYGSSNGSDWELITSYTNTVQGINEQWNIDLSSNNKAYGYYRIESTAGGTGGYWTIGELTITAQEQIPVESTSSDYDYYVRQETKMY